MSPIIGIKVLSLADNWHKKVTQNKHASPNYPIKNHLAFSLDTFSTHLEIVKNTIDTKPSSNEKSISTLAEGFLEMTYLLP